MCNMLNIRDLYLYPCHMILIDGTAAPAFSSSPKHHRSLSFAHFNMFAKNLPGELTGQAGFEIERNKKTPDF